jgi:hypothetical protein
MEASIRTVRLFVLLVRHTFPAVGQRVWGEVPASSPGKDIPSVIITQCDVGSPILYGDHPDCLLQNVPLQHAAM